MSFLPRKFTWMFKWSKHAVPNWAEHVCVPLSSCWCSRGSAQNTSSTGCCVTDAQCRTFCHHAIFSFVSYFQVGNHRCQLTLQGRWGNCASPLETSSIIIHCLLLQYVCPRWQEWEIHLNILFNSKTEFIWSVVFCKATQFSLSYWQLAWQQTTKNTL